MEGDGKWKMRGQGWGFREARETGERLIGR